MKRSGSPVTDVADSHQNPENTPLNPRVLFQQSQSVQQPDMDATTFPTGTLSFLGPQASASESRVEQHSVNVSHPSSGAPASILKAALTSPRKLSNLNHPSRSVLQPSDVRVPPSTVDAITLSPTSRVDYLISQGFDPSVKQPLVSSFQSSAAAQLPVVNPSSSSANLDHLSSEASCSTSSLKYSDDQNPAGEDKIVTKQQLLKIISDVCPGLELDDDVTEMLQDYMDIFVNDVITKSCMLARHRKSNILEAVDVALHLKQNCNMVIPGFGPQEPKPDPKHVATEEHEKKSETSLTLKKSPKSTKE